MLKTKIQLKDRFVRDFVIARYGEGSATIKIDRRSFLGKAVELGASKVGYQHCLPRQPDFEETLCITILMPDAMKTDYIQPAKRFLLADLINRHFYELFLVEIETLVEGGLSDYDAVSHYMKKYGIEDNVRFKDSGKIDDRLRKKWRDHSVRMKKRIDKYDENKVEDFL
jgi:hypothetical protein